MQTISFAPGHLTIEKIEQLLAQPLSISLDPACWKQIQAAETVVNNILQTGRTVYGINTGFGLLATRSISATDLSTLQRHLLLSHATGLGVHLPDDVVKLMLLFKINSLARGYSGVRPIIIETLIQLYNHRLYPCVPSKGSVGASGDLAPLSHLSLVLIGKGEVRYNGQQLSAKEAFKRLRHPTLTLAAKEGLALINGTQASTATAFYYLLQAQRLLSASVLIGALSVDAAMGSDVAFHPAIHAIRGHTGQIKVAQVLRTCLEGSQIRASHSDCSRVQDPYCLRCQPQVIGASLDNMAHVEMILLRELNAVTDNPLIFTELDEVMSGGNFHAEPVAQAADLLAIALSEIGAIAERRIALLIDATFSSGLPPFLVKNPGLNSGFMIAHVTAAALASANKSLAHPASVDSIPTSANQEDHVSMAMYAASRLKDMIENVEGILAVELLAACQGIELRRPLRSSKKLEKMMSTVRKSVPFWHEDRLFEPDLKKAIALVRELGWQNLSNLFERKSEGLG